MLINNLFAYIETDYSVPHFGLGRYKSFCVTDENGVKTFKSIIDADNYNGSIETAINGFLRFCKDECNLSENSSCIVWVTDSFDKRPALPYFGSTDHRDLEFDLIREKNIGLQSIELSYKGQIENDATASTFEQVKIKCGYSIGNEPIATRNIFMFINGGLIL